MENRRTPSGKDIAVTLAAVVVIVAGLRTAGTILVPFLLALFITVISTPFMVWLKRRGLPDFLAVIAVLSVILIAGVLVVAYVGASIQDFTSNTELYQRTLSEKWNHLVEFIAKLPGMEQASKDLSDALNAESLVRYVGRLLSGLGSTFGNAFLVGLVVLFMMLETSSFPRKLRAIFGSAHEGNERVARIVEDVRHYMFLKTIISLVTGCIIALGLTAMDMKYPLMWGMLAFFFNYVPNIGSIIAAVPAVMMGLLLGESLALPIAVATLYVVVNVAIGNFVEPRVMGKGLGLSTLVVFLSLVFWGWVLGPVGMLLSVPLTMAFKIALDSSEETRWLAILLGPDVAPEVHREVNDTIDKTAPK